MNNEYNSNGTHSPHELRQSYEMETAEQEHVAAVRNQIDQMQREVLLLKGTILDKQSEIDSLRRHLAFYVGALAAASGLPPAGAYLGPDGKTIAVRG